MKRQYLSFLGLFIITFSSQITCKKPEPVKHTGVVIFAVGDVTIAGRKLSLGDTINESEVLLTGKSSMCDIQLSNSEAGVVIRIKADSEFKLNPSTDTSGSDVNMALRVGSALFKVNNKLTKNQSIRVSMPTMVAGVRGTSFSAQISKSGDVSLQVAEGSVSTRPSIEAIDSLPEEIKNNSQAIQELEKSLSKNEQVLEPGQMVTIPKTYTDNILVSSGLDTAIKEANESIKKGDLSAATAKLDQTSGSTAEEKKQFSEKLSASKPIAVQTVAQKDIQSQLKEFEELIAIEKQKLDNAESRKTEITSRNQSKKDQLLKRIEQITGKSSETLILKNGTRVQGVVIQEGDTYHVLTTDGKKSFSESEVEGTEF